MTSAENQSEKPGHSLAGNERTVRVLREQQQAWEAFATEAVHIIPVLKAQMTAVTQETEKAAIELVYHLRVLASSDGAATYMDDSDSLSKVVMAMQFQDITRQKLEHVGLALDQLSTHLQTLLKDPLDQSAKREIAALQVVARNYTMEEERRLHAAAVKPDYQEPVPIEPCEEGTDAVTLF
jgi:hypothetical protein